MAFYGYHGVLPEENTLGQRFVVNLSVELDLQIAGNSDNLEDTVNYAELYQLCRDIVEGKPYKLLEAVAEKIAAKILGGFPTIKAVSVNLVKPDPPIQGYYRSVAVDIKRVRHGE